MTDLPHSLESLPARLGAAMAPPAERGNAPYPELHGRLVPRPETCVHGAVRASVVTFLVDMVAGILVDTDAAAWTFTSDLSLRLPAVPAPTEIRCSSTVLRRGNRGITTASILTDVTGHDLGYGLAGFSLLARRPGDPPKAEHDWDRLGELRFLDRPFPEATGVAVEDAAHGVVSCAVREELRNPAGAMQGAVDALLGELAAEVAASHHAGTAQVVTELDLRYLAQARIGPVVSAAAPVGPPTEGSWRVELRDTGNADRLVTSILARTRPAPTDDEADRG